MASEEVELELYLPVVEKLALRGEEEATLTLRFQNVGTVEVPVGTVEVPVSQHEAKKLSALLFKKVKMVLVEVEYAG